MPKGKLVNVKLPEFKIEDMPLSCTWVIIGPPASGKCLGVDTPILMLDGTIKKVQDIAVGDVLMGDDGSPRTVSQTTSGTGTLYRVNQSNGMSYVANGAHVLCLRSINSSNPFYVEEMSIEDYLELEKKDRASLRGYRFDTYSVRPDFVLPSSHIDVIFAGEGPYYGFGIDGNGRFLLGDGTVTHNTTLMENFAYYRKHVYPVGRVFIGTEDGYRRMCDIFHPLFVSNYWDEKEEESHVMRQRTCEMENGRGYAGNYAVNILDDISDDPKIYKTKLIRGLFKMGSQHWAQLLMLGSQYAIDLPPDVRKSVSYVALGREPEPAERKKLYENFGGLAGSYDRFADLMDQVTGQYRFLVIKKRSQSNELEDCISWYKTVPLGKWKFGCKEYRKWGQERYDTNYVEKIVM